ncbi:MAG: hypothetical protein A2Y45_01080 [Tenericutes bacterium GWC2_34_14]|nr:MAG: hypothetical protein A2Z84_01765 [Tenericutes bacterium GWA2_35_7]OHE29490.1 MAG: hypothetical protein A2Y45_01080 [Tenericutes bacterium GWC2_34_14]OHE34586.1 MAG: hypothetical protein A2012_08700 [Tenericutes bacterium GWE2_34_108]OHE35943.1 MAG: hypothetical protein A2Y46_03405 [Tenericutes bacterium GWF1_35_14]OHE38971.1 MAG: hypothetical protein A2Y44_06525 [Tenericutes bacterium GWF2_35_184]OHE42289.1 MAG: hypothetical protein A3K26_00575 [Tenericutes bacterium RIFOXYA12_FULL_35_
MKYEILLKDYPLITYDKIRYQDTDRQGHVNNANFPAFIETGRVELLYNPDKPLHHEDCHFVLAHISYDLLNEINYPGKVDIGARITKIGNSSIAFEHALFQNDVLVCKGTSVVVHVSKLTKKSVSLSEETKLYLSHFL